MIINKTQQITTEQTECTQETSQNKQTRTSKVDRTTLFQADISNNAHTMKSTIFHCQEFTEHQIYESKTNLDLVT